MDTFKETFVVESVTMRSSPDKIDGHYGHAILTDSDSMDITIVVYPYDTKDIQTIKEGDEYVLVRKELTPSL